MRNKLSLVERLLREQEVVNSTESAMNEVNTADSEIKPKA